MNLELSSSWPIDFDGIDMVKSEKGVLGPEVADYFAIINIDDSEAATKFRLPLEDIGKGYLLPIDKYLPYVWDDLAEREDEWALCKNDVVF